MSENVSCGAIAVGFAGPLSQTALEETPFKPAAAAPVTTIRKLDFVLAMALIIFFAPVMMLIALLTWVTDPGPILFAHRRVGRHGAVIPCFKFRSMAVDAQERLAHLLMTDPSARLEWERNHKLINDPRVTAFGHFLRRTSLDELPQLFNVLRGEMSLVGPRPITDDEIYRYGRYINDYRNVVPGITGLWQISGRSETSYRRRVALDVLYVRNQSPALYLSVLARTLPAVLLARGAR